MSPSTKNRPTDGDTPRRKAQRERWHRNKEVLKAKRRAWWRKNKEKQKLKAQIYNKKRAKIRRAQERARYKKDPLKFKVRSAVRYAVRSGKISKSPCEVCGIVKVDGHHDDYAKPLEVRWLCRKHHAELHSDSTAKKK